MAKLPPGVIPVTDQGCPVYPADPLPSPWGDGGGPGAGASQQAAAAKGPDKPTRTLALGGFFAQIARNPSIKIFEYVYRTEPNEAWFDPARNPSNPTQFELGTVTPQKGQTLVVMDYEIRPYRFAGVNSYDFLPMIEGRLSGALGYAIRINGNYPADFKYQLDPVDSRVMASQRPNGGNPFQLTSQLNDDRFATVQASQYAAAAGFGTGLMPQWPRKYGPTGDPFAEVLTEEMSLTAYGVIYRRLESPVAFIQTRVSGYQGSTSVIAKLFRELADSVR